jgi:hypothetical protein
MQGVMTVDDDEIVAALTDAEDPAFVTAELAERFDMSVPGMKNRLEDLHAEGRIHKKQPSPQIVIWWAPTAHDCSVFSA